MKNNHRLRDLFIDGEMDEDLTQIAKQIKIKPTDLARILLKQSISELKAGGFQDLRIALVGIKDHRIEKEVKK